jgi:predicted FMN-binding regulatory protein PaiB
VGFKISVTDIQYKKKLSQNRLSADRAGVMKGLETRTDDNSRGVLINMKKLYTT